MSDIELHEGDNRLILRKLIDQGVRVHSVVTDPPYGLVSIQKRFGKEGSKSARTDKNDGSFARLSGGFMGKQWDATGIERDPEFWKLIYEILLPGGCVFAFSGSRTGHWQACAMETAGFIMHPMHIWAFGQGFPKAHAADKAIDKLLNADRPILGYADVGPDMTNNNYGRDGGERRISAITAPGSPEAAEWQGWAYGTQTQKPAVEPIYLGQKPFSEKTGAANLLKHGVGAFNIDGCRVPHITVEGGDLSLNPHLRQSINGGNGGHIFPKEIEQRVVIPNVLGRHPSNLILDGSPEVVAMFPAKAGASAPVKGDEPSDVTKSIYGKFNSRVPGQFYGDEGSAARFFHQFPPDMNPIIYHSKAGKDDRAGSDHPTVKPINLLRYLVRHLTPPGGTVLDPFAGSGTTGAAARLEGINSILIEMEREYAKGLRRRFGMQTQQDFDDLLDINSNSTDCRIITYESLLD